MPPVSKTTNFASSRSTAFAATSSRTPCNTSQTIMSVPETLALKCSVEPVCLRIPHALEVVDQNGCVDDDHATYFA